MTYNTEWSAEYLKSDGKGRGTMSEEIVETNYFELGALKAIIDVRRELLSKGKKTNGAHRAYVLGALGELDVIEGILDNLASMPPDEEEEGKP